MVDKFLLFQYGILELLNFFPDILLVSAFGGHPRYVFVFDFLPDDILESNSFSLQVQIVDIEHIVPQFVVVEAVMRFDVFILFLEYLLGDPANKAHPLLVLLNLLPLLSQFGKGVNQHTAHNVAEQQLHEYGVNHIEEKATRLKRLHF